MAGVFISPVGGVAAQFFTNNGVILSGGKLYTYASGTTTPKTAYTSFSGATAHTNPIILDSAGRVPSGEIWLSASPYKFVLKDSTDVLIGTYDNVIGIGAASFQVQNFTGDGSTINYTLSNASVGENFTFVYVNGVYQQKNTYSISGVTLTFSAAPPYTSTIEVMYN
jgi:hypothetical protein